MKERGIPMNEEKKILGMNKRTFIMICLIVAAVILVAALTILLISLAGGTKEKDGPAETTAAAAADDYILYWNVERSLYAGQDATGMSSREPNPDTGYFQVLFAMEGRQGIRRVKERKIVNKIDNMDLMGLVLDENGIIADVQSIEEITGGYAVNKFFVQGINDNVVTVNSSNTMQGMEVEITLTDKTKIYDVSGETGEIGCASGLYEMDCIIAIQNKAGEITHIYAVEREPQGPSSTHYCDHCKQEVTWRAWMYESTLPTSGIGHYYLYNDVKLSGQMSMAANTQIILNLNGKTVTGNGANRMYSLHNEGTYLGIMDYSEEKNGKFQVTGNISGQGGCVWARYGTFEMWSGTLDASKCTNALNGVAVCIDGKSETKAASVFNMYGGTIIGGTAQTQYNKAANSTSGGLGGAVMNYGEFNMMGGTIIGGYAKSVYKDKDKAYAGGSGGAVAVHSVNSVFNMKGGTIKNGKSDYSGGNIWMGGGCTVNISGGTISGGETLMPKINGGNVFNSGCTLNISGGTIKDGVTRNCGANVYSNKNLTISGGTITGGMWYDEENKKKDYSNNGNLFIVNGVTVISGGKIDGHAQLIATDDNKVDITISGKPVISGAQGGKANLLIPGGTVLKLGKLSEGTKIGVTASGVFTEKTDPNYKKYFTVDNSTVAVSSAADCLCVGEVKTSCLCGKPGGNHMTGCDEVELAWTAWGNANSLPTSGNYYLTGNVTVNNQSWSNNKVNIALNGYKIQGSAKNRPLQLRQGAEMTLTSWGKSGSAVTGTMVDPNAAGGLVLMHMYFDNGQYPAGTVAPTLTAFGVTFDASNVKNCADGGAFSIGSKKLEDNSIIGSTVALYGCTVKGATVTNIGGAIRANSDTKLIMVDTNVSGGTVAPEKSPSKAATIGGGNIYIGANATATITGGTISGGTVKDLQNLDSYGGNVCTLGKVTMNKVTIEKGEALEPNDVNGVARGGNLYVQGGTFEAIECQIVNGHSHWQGGNVVVDGASTKATFTLCNINQGNSDNQGENMAIFGGEVNVVGTVIGERPASDTTHVSNLFINSSNAQLNLSSYIDKSNNETQTRIGMGVSIFNIKGMKLTGKVSVHQFGIDGIREKGITMDMSGLTSGTIGINAGAEYTFSTNLKSDSAVVFESRNTAYEVVVDGGNVSYKAKAA